MSDYTDDQDKAWSLADKIQIAFFITWDGERQRARPMSAVCKREDHAIYLLTDAESAKSHQIERFPTVTLAFADKGHNDFVSITGQAVVSNDRQKIAEIWSPFAKAYWDSPEDPDIRIIKVSPDDAEFWDGPNGPIATVKLLANAVTSGRPDMGDNAKVGL